MLPSVEEMGGKLSEGMGAIEFRLNVVRPNVVRPIDFRLNDVRPIDLWANDVRPIDFRPNVLSKIHCEDAAIIS